MPMVRLLAGFLADNHTPLGFIVSKLKASWLLLLVFDFQAHSQSICRSRAPGRHKRLRAVAFVAKVCKSLIFNIVNAPLIRLFIDHLSILIMKNVRSTS